MTEPPVRPLSPHGQESDAVGRRSSRLGALLLAVIAAALVLWWPSPAEEAPVEPIAIDPVESIAAFVPPPPPAVESFERFVSAVSRGDSTVTVELLARELPEVAGLGTFSFPLADGDPGLWASGRLDTMKVAGFVAAPPGLPGPVAVSNCSAFGDGPAVTIVACDYAAGGVTAFPSFRPERGTLFGFMLDSAVAGVAHRIGVDDPGPIP